MRRRHAWLGLTVLLGGMLVLLPLLADAPPRRAPLETAAYTTDDPPADAWRSAPDRSEPIHEYTILSGGFNLGAGEAAVARVSMNIPERTVSTLVTFTFHVGASQGFAFDLASACQHKVGPLVVGDGRKVTYDCGATLAGSRDLVLTHTAGHLQGVVEVAVRVCPERGPCPGPGQEYR